MDYDYIELDALPVCDDRYIKIKTEIYGDKVSPHKKLSFLLRISSADVTKTAGNCFCGLHVPEDRVGCKSFTVISIASLLVYHNIYYLQVYLDNCTYRIVDNQMIDDLDDNLFETDEDYVLWMLYYDKFDLSEGIDLTKSNYSKVCMVCYY